MQETLYKMVKIIHTMYWDTCLSVESFVYEWQGGKFCLYGHCVGFRRVRSYGTSHLTYFWAIKQSTIQIKLRWALFVKYTIIMRSEMCSLHLTHPSGWMWAADCAAPGEQLGVWCLAQGSHVSRGHFLPELGFEPTTLGYLRFQVQHSIL